MKKKYLILAISVLIVGSALYLRIGNNKPEEMPVPDDQSQPIKAVFNCQDGKNISVEFTKNKAGLTLSDGRKIELDQTISGSGARYADSGEKIVFWNKGDTAFIEENGQTTYAECLVAK